MLLTHCAPKDPVDDDGDTALDGVEVSVGETDGASLAASLLSVGAGPLGLANDAESLTPRAADGALEPADLGDAAKFFFFPRGCLDTVHDAGNRTVTYRFQSCAGPRGLLRVTGKLVASYTQNANDRLTIDFAADDLRINRTKANWTARAEVASTGLARTMNWTMSMDGTVGNRAVSRRSDYKLDWALGEGCLAIAGGSTGQVGQRGAQLTIEGFKRCRRECPEAGGKVALVSRKDATTKTYGVTFDGSDEATVTLPNGATRRLALLCGR
jgi:hypothetical protein